VKNMKSYRRRGFALIATLGAVSLALLLLGAFLQSNRAFFTLTRLDQDRQACHEALLSVSEYLRFKFEEERGWGNDTWDGKELVPLSGSRVLFSLQKIEPGSSFEGQGLVGHRHLLGPDPEHDAEIHIAFSNNLQGDIGLETQAFDSEGGVTTEEVPAKSCIVRISATKGGHTERAEIALRRAAFFDSTLASSDGIDIVVRGYSDDSDAVVFNSRDPVRNQIRSGQDINLPNRNLLSFRNNESDTPPTKGTVWSKKDVYFADSKEAEDIQAAVEQHSIEVVDQAKNHYNVPELSADDIEVGESEANTLTLSSRKYIFTQAEVAFDRPGNTSHQLQLRVLKEVDPVTNEVIRFHYNENDINSVAGTVRIIPAEGEAGHIPADLRGTPQGDDEFRIDNDKIKVQMRGEDFDEDGVISRGYTEPRMVLPKAAKVDSGNFQVFADDYNLVPTISFGENESRGYLSVDGDIALEGYIKGGGKILSREGSVHLFPNDVDVETDQRTELAVFAKENVLIAPPNNESVNETSEVGTSEFYFRGLVYAGKNFAFRTSQGYDRRLTVEGAVVARDGKIEIESQAGVRLIYNPKYLDDFLEKKALERKVQVEELSWRPI
jgi:hypothetical protein